jgi:hypothetical protein
MFMTRSKRSKLAVAPYRNHSKFKWKIAGYYVNGKRVRRFFTTRSEAETFMDQLQTNQG